MKKIQMRISRLAKKLKAINYMGGKCATCGETNFFKLCFHHLNDDKKYNINFLSDNRWSMIEEEIKKCQLLCYNCHTELHNSNKYKPSSTNKEIFLKYKDVFKCEKCGHDKLNSLEFHHKNQNIKDFELSRIHIIYYSVEDLIMKITNELDKCQVLCKNCHLELHFNEDNFYYDNYKEILEKSKNIKEIQSKIDRNKVLELYEQGYKQVDIAKYFNASKGTISGIFKKFKENQ